MKTFLIIVLVALAAYFIYVNFVAEHKAKAVKKAEEKIFEERYSAALAAKQSEAQQWARMLINKQEEYKALHGRYASSIKELGFVPRIGQYYRAKVVSADENDFHIEIRGNIDRDPTEDVWDVTRDGFQHAVDDVVY